MTNAEKETVSKAIAEALAEQGIPVQAWMTAVFVCPACHNHSNSDWNYTAKAGEWCMLCGEGRLVSVPLDFTRRLYLVPAVKAWIEGQPVDEGWTYQVAWCAEQAVANIYELVDQGWGRYYSGADETDEMVALALAFQQALSARKEDRENEEVEKL